MKNLESTVQQGNDSGSELVGRRALAALLDGFICFVAGALVVRLVGLDFSYEANSSPNFHAVNRHLLLDGLVLLAVSIAYWAGWELLSRTTPGKFIFNLRVTDISGRPASARQVFIRNVVRVVDILPAVYLIGFIALLATGRRGQRIGDLAAHTVVSSH